MHQDIKSIIADHKKCIELLYSDTEILNNLDHAIRLVTNTFRNGGKVLFCGNGGSAADSEHLAGELSGKFRMHRDALNAEALHVNAAALTAVANDYSFEEVYARLLSAKAQADDVLIAISTSGTSKNILKLIQKAKELKVKIIGMGGTGGTDMIDACDIHITIPSTDTPRIQEAYMLLGHILCEKVESNLFRK